MKDRGFSQPTSVLIATLPVPQFKASATFQGMGEEQEDKNTDMCEGICDSGQSEIPVLLAHLHSL
jgi:hypothetical protein